MQSFFLGCIWSQVPRNAVYAGVCYSVAGVSFDNSLKIVDFSVVYARTSSLSTRRAHLEKKHAEEYLTDPEAWMGE